MNIIQNISELQTVVQCGKEVNWEQFGYVRVIYKGDLVLFNYSSKAEIENRWNWFERNSRGLILNWKTGEIVARPFEKFWNWFQRGRVSKGHIVTITEKIDGSCGIVYRDGGIFKVATRGSFDSEQAVWATNWLNKHIDLSDCPEEYTLICEVVYPENRIVVDYEGLQGLFLLAIRNRFTGEYLPFYPDVYNFWTKYPQFYLPTVHNFNSVTDIIAATDTLSSNKEGWVVLFSDGQRFKFKGDRYLDLHRIVTNLSFNRILKHAQNGTYNRLLFDTPDEFHEEIKQWKREIDIVVNSFVERVDAQFEIAPKESRRKFALWVQEYCSDIRPYMFAKLDNKSYESIILKREF